MKATGIIRRIDELGRIVIPKEIRKVLHIKEGENLEIYVDETDNIILKKYSMIKKINDFAQIIADAVHTFTKHDVIISDNDTILAATGSLKKTYINKSISTELEKIMSKRDSFTEPHVQSICLTSDKVIATSYVISPIVVNGDAIGMVMVLGMNDIIDDTDIKISQIVSQFLKVHLEE